MCEVIIFLVGGFCAIMLMVKLVTKLVELSTTKKCPFWRERIAWDATICKHCRQEVD